MDTKQAHAAHSQIAYAIKTGKITRATKCAKCNAQGVKIEAAHVDYSRPLSVILLCVGCHRRMDRAKPRGGTRKVLDV